MPRGLSSVPDAERTPLRDLPPSAKLVYLVLSERGELTQQQLATETLLSKRTTRQALGELADAGLVTSRQSFMDARRKLYAVAGATD